MNTNKLLNISKMIETQIGWCWSEEGKAVLDDDFLTDLNKRRDSHDVLLPLQRLCSLQLCAPWTSSLLYR